MPANATAATVVGNKFVFEYYTSLSQKPEEIATYYKAESTLTSGIGSFDVSATYDAETETFYGASNIDKKVKLTNFKGSNVIVSNINCQESLNGGIIVAVLGTIQTKRDNGEMNPARAFAQTFFLGVQSEPIYSYFVLNDIFLFVNTTVNPSPKQTVPIPTQVAPLSFTVASVPKDHHHQQTHPQTHHHATAPTPVVEAPKPVVHTQTAHSHDHSHPHSQGDAHHTQQPHTHSTAAPEQHAHAHPHDHPHPHPEPAVQTTVSATSSSSQEKQTKPHKEHKEHKEPKDKKPRNPEGSSPTPRNNNEWTQVEKKKEGKSPRVKRDNKEKTDGQPHQGQDKKTPRTPKQTNGQQGRKQHDKKEHHEHETTTQHQQGNGAPAVQSSPKPNSWATVARVEGEQVVFAPPPVVYTEKPVEETPKPAEKEKKKEEKPKRREGPKKETSEEAAMRSTRELRSIRVGNLPYDIEEPAVNALFKQFGEIKDIVLKSGYGYVEFFTISGVTNSLNFVKKNELEIQDPKTQKFRTLKIEQRKPKEYVPDADKPFYKEEKIALEKKKEQAPSS